FAQGVSRAAAEAGTGWQVRLEAASALDDATRTIVVSGTWDLRCPPQFSNLVRGDRGLAIHLVAATTGCEPAVRAPFAVRIDFDALTGEDLAPVVQPAWVYLDAGHDARLVGFGVLD